jgi:hypothetical protein
VPTVDKLSRCETAQEVEDIPIPATNELVGFEGLAIFIPGPFLRDAIITSNSNYPFDLIPLMNSRARDFETEVVDILAEMNGNPINQADDLNTWLYGIKQGTIPETRYSVLPNDDEITQFNFQQHQACISRGEDFKKLQESLGQLITKQQTLTTMHQFCSNSPPPSQPKTKKQLNRTISAKTRSYAKSAKKNQRKITPKRYTQA